MKKYRCIFFDLDHTLWDYDSNSRETLRELYSHHEISQASSIEFDHFHDSFQRVNFKLWDQYDRGIIDREVIRDDRFRLVLSELGYENNELARRLSEHYSVLSPTKKKLVPNAKEILEYLSSHYPLYLVTNGFEAMQSTKVISGGIREYFQDVITSERAGFKKPAKEIFDYTRQLGGYSKSDVVMIGDNLLTDIAGAIGAGIDSVYFNPKGEKHVADVTYEISNLIELKGFL